MEISRRLTFNVDFSLVGTELDWREQLNIEVEEGIITHVGNGYVGNAKHLRGLLMPSLVNSHVHSGDFLILEDGYNLNIREAVGDPESFKYSVINSTQYDLKKSIEMFLSLSYDIGVKTVVDFREQGIKGSMNAKEVKEKRSKLNYIILGRLEEDEFSDASLKKLKDIADGYGLPSPSVKYNYSSIRNYFPLRASHFAETLSHWLKYNLDEFLNLYSPSFIVHGTWLGDDELRVLAESKIPLVICPRSNMWFSVGIPKVDSIIESEVDLFLGSDNAAWISPNLWRDLELALLISRIRKPGSDYSREILMGATTKPSDFFGIKNTVKEGTPLWMLNLIDVENSAIKRAKNKYIAILKRGGDYIVKLQELSKP